MGAEDNARLSLAPSVVAPFLTALAATTHARQEEGQRAACEGQRHIRSYPGGFFHHERTFIYREETLSQDVAATPELHPEPAVCGDEGLRGFVATKPTWEVKRNSQAAGGQQEAAYCRQRESGVSLNVVQGGNSSCSTHRSRRWNGNSHTTVSLPRNALYPEYNPGTPLSCQWVLLKC